MCKAVVILLSLLVQGHTGKAQNIIPFSDSLSQKLIAAELVSDIIAATDKAFVFDQGTSKTFTAQGWRCILDGYSYNKNKLINGKYQPGSYIIFLQARYFLNGDTIVFVNLELIAIKRDTLAHKSRLISYDTLVVKRGSAFARAHKSFCLKYGIDFTMQEFRALGLWDLNKSKYSKGCGDGNEKPTEMKMMTKWVNDKQINKLQALLLKGPPQISYIAALALSYHFKLGGSCNEKCTSKIRYYIRTNPIVKHCEGCDGEPTVTFKEAMELAPAYFK